MTLFYHVIQKTILFILFMHKRKKNSTPALSGHLKLRNLFHKTRKEKKKKFRISRYLIRDEEVILEQKNYFDDPH